jgi:hypothetical protein
MKKMVLICLLSLPLLAVQAQDNPYPTKALKYDFFSPVAGCFGGSYETWFKKGTTLEINAGFIGIKLDDYFNNDQFIGGYASIGPRFYFQLDEMDGIDNYNDFSGFYIKPELLFNYFSFEDQYQHYTYWMDDFGNYYDSVANYTVSGNDFSVSLLMGLGRQWTFRDIMVLDLWFALGYGGDWVNADTDQLPDDNYYYANNSFKYSYVRMGESPMIFDGGLSIGLLIK